MPRLTDTTRERQRRRFLDGLRRLVSARGLHNVSMEDIRIEAGVSAGAMYRYFTAKDELIRAAIADSMAGFEQILAEVASDPTAAADPASFVEALLARLDAFSRASDDVDLYRIALQGWAFAQGDASTMAEIAAVQERAGERIATVATRWTADQPTRAGLVDVVLACVLGHVVRGAWGRPADPPSVAKGLRGLNGRRSESAAVGLERGAHTGPLGRE